MPATTAAERRRLPVGAILAAGLLLGACVRFSSQSQASFVNGNLLAVSQRQSRVACPAVDKAMKERITSVIKTGKLTDAMRLVAAAKVRRAQDGVLKARPFSSELQAMIKGLVKKLKGSGLEAELPMLRVPEKVQNVGILLMASNRGLCGPFNTFIFKRAIVRIKQLNEQGIVPKIIAVGRKCLTAFNTRLSVVEFNYTGTFFSTPDTITAKLASEIGDAVRTLFLSGEVDKVEVISAKFFNLLKNEPMLKTLLPLSPTGIEDPDDETFKMTTEDGKIKVEKEKVKAVKAKEIENDVIFDQPPEVILNSMLPLYLNSQIYSLLYDSQASELSARMTAMKAATDNAADLSKRLTTIYNKKRQASITQEICEISAGAMAIEDNNKARPLGVFDNSETVGPDFLRELEDGSIPDSPPEPQGPEWRTSELA